MKATDLLSPDSSTSIREPIQLRDGTEVRLHAMRGDDADALLRFHHRLSPETTYLRFFSVHPELSSGELERFTHVDHRDREAIVATVDEEIVGVARFDRVDGDSEAEAAFVIADVWQGEGLGTALFERLTARARELGIERFTAEVLPHNRRMLNLFHHSGLPVTARLQDGVVHVVLDLGEEPVTGS
jgi:RimJ/RimL family protein N-acetyltransferase